MERLIPPPRAAGAGRDGARGAPPSERDACEARRCLGCPAAARGLLLDLVDAPPSCAFASHAIEAREPVSAEHLERSGFAIVRRGYLIRDHVDVDGTRTAIDVVGPGGCFALDRAVHPSGQPRVAAYAVTRALLCTCSEADRGRARARRPRRARALRAPA